MKTLKSLFAAMLMAIIIFSNSSCSKEGYGPSFGIGGDVVVAKDSTGKYKIQQWKLSFYAGYDQFRNAYLPMDGIYTGGARSWFSQHNITASVFMFDSRPSSPFKIPFLDINGNLIGTTDCLQTEDTKIGGVTYKSLWKQIIEWDYSKSPFYVYIDLGGSNTCSSCGITGKLLGAIDVEKFELLHNNNQNLASITQGTNDGLIYRRENS